MAKDDKKVTVNVFKDKGPAGFAAFLAFVGAFVYFAQGAHDFAAYFNAFINALVWPAILVFHVLQMLHA